MSSCFHHAASGCLDYPISLAVHPDNDVLHVVDYTELAARIRCESDGVTRDWIPAVLLNVPITAVVVCGSVVPVFSPFSIAFPEPSSLQL